MIISTNDDFIVSWTQGHKCETFWTFMLGVWQVLHYKLHNDDWRRDQELIKKDYGVPGECR